MCYVSPKEYFQRMKNLDPELFKEHQKEYRRQHRLEYNEYQRKLYNNLPPEKREARKAYFRAYAKEHYKARTK